MSYYYKRNKKDFEAALEEAAGCVHDMRGMVDPRLLNPIDDAIKEYMVNLKGDIEDMARRLEKLEETTQPPQAG